MKQTEFETIYRSRYATLFRVAYIRLRQEDEARDVVQEAMLRLWQIKRMPDNVDAYLMRSVLNGVVDCLRARGLDERSRIVMDETVSGDYDSDDETCRMALRAKVERILDKDISAEAAAAFRAVYMRGLTYDESAAVLGVTRATVNKHVVNVLRKLRERITNINSE